MESDDDFRSLFSIPLSSLFNFQRGTSQLPHHRPPAANNGLSRQPAVSTSAGAAAFGNFTSQSSGDSAHFSGNEEELCGSPLIKYDVCTPINIMELDIGPTDMEIDDSHLSFPNTGSVANRANHSEVEKLRRDRMNGSIGEIAALVPACKSASRKLDKLTVLRLAVQHIKLVRVRSVSLLQSPAEIFGTEELRHLLSRASSLHGFVLVIECDRARILCATNCDNCGIPGVVIKSSDLIGQCFLDLVHPKDADPIRQQMMAPDPVQRQWAGGGCGGLDEAGIRHSLRRRFFCRFRVPAATDSGGGKRKGDTRQYVYLNCTGFLHLSDPVQPSGQLGAAADQSEDNHQAPAQSTCLTVLCRSAEPLIQSALPATVRNSQDWQFTAKLSLEACFTWVDQRVAAILGHLPQDLIGCSLYDLVSREDVNRLSVAHRSALKGTRSRLGCRLRSAWQTTGPPGEPCSVCQCQISLVSFINPCTGRPELLSLACVLQPVVPHHQHHQQQHQQVVSFPSVAQPVAAADTCTAGSPLPPLPLQPGPAVAAALSSALIGIRVAAELTQPTQLPPPQLQPDSADTPQAGGWLALGQLISASQLITDAETPAAVAAAAAAGEALATTRMALLGADGGLGEEPDYGSLLWPL